MATKRFHRQLHILVSAEVHRMLNVLAERDEITPSDVVRQLIRRAYAEAVSSSVPNAVKQAQRIRKIARRPVALDAIERATTPVRRVTDPIDRALSKAKKRK